CGTRARQSSAFRPSAAAKRKTPAPPPVGTAGVRASGRLGYGKGLPAPAGAAAGALAAAALAGGALLARAGLVDRQGAALEHGAVEVLDGGLAALAHLDEAEAARAARLTVLDDLGARHAAELAERLAEVVGGGAEGEV